MYVDPFDIGAIPDDSRGAIRARRYFVYRSFVGVNKNLYHSSSFAALNDEEYARMVADSVAKSRKQFQDKASELEALIDTSYGKQQASFTNAYIGNAADIKPYPTGEED